MKDISNYTKIKGLLFVQFWLRSYKWCAGGVAGDVLFRNRRRGGKFLWSQVVTRSITCVGAVRNLFGSYDRIYLIKYQYHFGMRWKSKSIVKSLMITFSQGVSWTINDQLRWTGATLFMAWEVFGLWRSERLMVHITSFEIFYGRRSEIYFDHNTCSACIVTRPN